MLKYIVIMIIILIFIGFLAWYLLLNHDKDRSGFFGKKDMPDDLTDDDLHQVVNLKKGGENHSDSNESTKMVSDAEEETAEISAASYIMNEEEPGTAAEEEFDFEPEYREEKKTEPFLWMEEDGDPIFDYRIFLNGKSEEKSVHVKKAIYHIGKNKTSDIVLETNDRRVGMDFLEVSPIEGKGLFRLKRVKEAYDLPIWSEEEGKWKPHHGEILFGEKKVVIALTQWAKVTDQNISRLELAGPGYLGEEDLEEAYSFQEEPETMDEDDIFNI